MRSLTSKLSRLFRRFWSPKLRNDYRHVMRPAHRRLFQEPLEARNLLSISPNMIDLDSATYSDPSDFVQVGEVCYFTAETTDYGRELWVTDGTESGTSLVKDIDDGSDSSNPSDLIAFDGKLYFTASDGENGRELWVSDGTESGTVLLKDINTDDATGSYPSYLTVVDEVFYFSADDGDNGDELWVSDGTADGTEMVKDIYSGTDSSSPAGLVDVDGTLFFVAEDGTNGVELWTSDGTADGTTLVSDINDGDGDAFERTGLGLVAVDDTLFFVADDGEHGYELWTSDGTTGGTAIVKDIFANSDNAFDVDSLQLAVMNDVLYFAASDGTNGCELWRSDGTESGTYLLKDIDDGSDGDLDNSTAFTVVNDTLYFSADDGEHGRELWMTDGTESGTVLVKDIASGSGDSFPYYMTNVGGTLYFTTHSDDYGREIWKSDGTESGTILVSDVVSGSTGSSPKFLQAVGDYLVLSAYKDSGRELYSIDITESNEQSAQLTIWVDGEQVTIPSYVGVYSTSNKAAVYTTDSSGNIVFDANDGTTLAEFFEIWRTNAGTADNNSDATFSSHELMDNDSDSSYTVTMFVNGEICYDFENYVMQGNDEIVLVYSDNPVVSLNTNYGSIVIELFEDETPITVDNFLDYVNDGDYVNSFFHRMVSGYCLQGGGFTTDSTTFTNTSQFTSITSNGTIDNESLLSNLYGTIAMARLTGYDTATSQFFINLKNNTFWDPSTSTSQDGYAVFGQVLDMTTVETIHDLPIDTSNSSPYGELPYDDSNNELVVVQSLAGMGDITGYKFYDADNDGVFDSDEEGMEGVTVFLDANDNGVLDDGESWATTDADGKYLLQAEAGTYTVYAEVSSGSSATTEHDSVTVEIGVETEDVNFGEYNSSAPTAVADTYTLDEDDPLTVNAANGVLANDNDPDDDSMTASIVQSPSHGTITLNSDGSFTYTPDDDYAGTDTFTYTASDGTYSSSEVSVTLTIEDVSDAPVAVNDALEVDNNSTAHELDVLDNDSDPDASDSISIASVTQGSNGGSVSILDGDEIIYMPADGFSGTETFTYTIQDEAGNEATATVTMTVNEGSSSGGDTTETGDSSLSGYVYVDIDRDGQFDSNETALPGVLVTLTGTSDNGNSVSQTRLTDNNGHYSFDDLPAGEYTLTETQPEIMLDGETTTSVTGATIDGNEISDIDLDDDESFEDNNFGERKIQSSYVTIRMFFASTATKLPEYLRTLVAYGEDCAGNDDLADAIRDAATEYDPGSNNGTGNENTAPEGENDSYTVNEDGTLTVSASNGVLKNDTDDDDDTLVASLVSSPTHGTFSFDSDGSFTYTPEANFSGTDTFTYVTYDGTNVSDTVTVTITVASVNDTPTAAADDYSVDENNTLTVSTTNGVLDNDSDPDDDTLTTVLVTDVSNGTLTLNSDGSFEYVPDVNFAGTDTFTYYATDGDLTTSTVTVTITVNEGEDVPVTTDDTYTIDEDNVLSVDSATGVLANDTDDDGDTLEAVLAQGPSNGSLTLNADGSFSYTPDADFSGTDTFTYYANDDTFDSSVTTVTITVTAINDTPVANEDAYTVDEDNTLTVSVTEGLLANDTDADGDDLEVVIVGDLTNGTLALNTDGSFSYVPDNNFNGTDSFTYYVTDGTVNSAQTTVTITVNAVNDAPVAGEDSYTVDEDNTLTISADSGLLANDSDADGSSLATVLVSDPSNGTLTLNSDGSFTYVPNADFNGTDSFTYYATDGNLYSVATTVTITVNAINDAPVAEADAYSLDEDNTLTVNADSGLLYNDTDVDGDNLAAVLGSDVTNGTLTLNTDGSFTYVPNAGFNGTDSFTYYITDGNLSTTVTTVTLTINSVNDTPVATGETYAVDEDNTLTVNVDAGLLINDTDADGDDLDAVLVDSPSNGSLTLNSDGSFTYDPAADFNGTDTFTYYVTDGTLDSSTVTVTITVNAINDAPVGVADIYTTVPNTQLDVDAASGLLSNDSDAEGDSLTVTLINDVDHGTLTLNSDGSFSYIPTTDYHGLDSFTYKTNDGNLDSEETTVEIYVNTTATATNDAYDVDEDNVLTIATAGVLTNDTDDDGDTLTATLVTGPEHGTLTLNTDGSFTYTPDTDFNGTDTFTYAADDGLSDPSEATVTITVNSINDAPTAAENSYVVDEDNALTVSTSEGLLSNDSDIDGDSLEAVVAVDPTNGTLTLNSDGSFTYVPAGDFSGTDTFTYYATDGDLASATTTVTITVNPINDAPTAAADAYSVEENSELTISADNGVLANDADADGDDLEAVLVDNPTNGSLALNSDGSFSYQPNTDFSGTDSFTYYTTDGTDSSATRTVTLTINAGNDAPTAGADAYTVSEDTPLTVSADNGLLANDNDVNGDSLEAVLVNGPTNGTLSLNANGSFTYQPADNFNGTDSFTYCATDGTTNSATTTVTFTVESVNDLPVANTDTVTLSGVSAIDIDVLGNDTDADASDILSISSFDSTSTEGATITANADGTLNYDPTTSTTLVAGSATSDSFTYTITDGNTGVAVTGTVTINLT